MINDEQLMEWERLAENATPGDWVVAKDNPNAITHKYGLFYWSLSHTVDESHNAAFIAASRFAVPALCACVHELKTALKACEAKLPPKGYHDVEKFYQQIEDEDG